MTLSPEARTRVLASRKQLTAVNLRPDIFDWYRDIAGSHRIHYDEQRSSWLVLHYADVQKIMLDPQNFSSQRALNPDGSVDEVTSGGFLGLDPPRHRHLRSLVALAFTQRRVAQLESRIRDIVDRLLDDLEDLEEADVVDALAFPLPVTVVAELLGLPLKDTDQFRVWAAELVGNDFALRVQAFARFTQYFDDLIEERSRAPQDDLLSELLRAEMDGANLSARDITNTCLLLLVAGHETTTALIGNTLWCLDEHPGAREELAAHPELLAGTVEEALRLRAVVHFIPRVVTRDVRFLDQDLREGDLVLPLFAAANLDPAQFAEPARFDIRRSPNRHIGFGYGIHLCLGASLARLEANIALKQLFARFPGLKRDHSRELEMRSSSFVFSFKHYPVRLRA
jgi:cytochrome P450